MERATGSGRGVPLARVIAGTSRSNTTAAVRGMGSLTVSESLPRTGSSGYSQWPRIENRSHLRIWREVQSARHLALAGGVRLIRFADARVLEREQIPFRVVAVERQRPGHLHQP